MDPGHPDPAWREAIPDIAITRVADEDLLTDAILQAAVVCAECLAPLADPPSVTGRLCQLHRTGPAGQPAVADPDTEGLYWLDGDTLTYAPIDSQRRSPCKDAGEPVRLGRAGAARLNPTADLAPVLRDTPRGGHNPDRATGSATSSQVTGYVDRRNDPPAGVGVVALAGSALVEGRQTVDVVQPKTRIDSSKAVSATD